MDCWKRFNQELDESCTCEGRETSWLGVGAGSGTPGAAGLDCGLDTVRIRVPSLAGEAKLV